MYEELSQAQDRWLSQEGLSRIPESLRDVEDSLVQDLVELINAYAPFFIEPEEVHQMVDHSLRPVDRMSLQCRCETLFIVWSSLSENPEYETH